MVDDQDPAWFFSHHAAEISRSLVTARFKSSTNMSTGSGPDILFLTAAEDQRLDPHAASDVKTADSFRPVNLVGGKRSQIEGRKIDGDLSRRLGDVAVKEHASLAADRSEIVDRLDRADLPIRRFDRSQPRVAPQRVAQAGRIDEAFAIRR